jgi:hypothetical protein
MRRLGRVLLAPFDRLARIWYRGLMLEKAALVIQAGLVSLVVWWGFEEGARWLGLAAGALFAVPLLALVRALHHAFSIRTSTPRWVIERMVEYLEARQRHEDRR